MLLDELQRLIDTEPAVASLITPYVRTIIHDLAVLGECMRQVDLYQPWALTFGITQVGRRAEIEEWFAGRASSWQWVQDLLDESKNNSNAKLSKLGNPSDKKFAYPVANRRTKDNADRLRAAEQSLDDFWAEMDHVVRTKAGSLKGTAVGKLLSEPRTLLRTPEWSPPPKGKHADHSAVRQISKPLSELYFDLEFRSAPISDPSATAAVGVAKKKVKTRGAPASEFAAVSNELAQSPAQRLVQPDIPVSTRVLKVFRTLFFQPSVDATPGKLRWTDFLHALTSVGFAAQHLYGSVWQFTPTETFPSPGHPAVGEGVTSGPPPKRPMRSIQFHQSHPGDIPYHTARRHGRRLARAYGWDGTVFVLRKKE